MRFWNSRWFDAAILLLILLCIAGIISLSGCGSTTDRQTKTVETEQWVLGPAEVESPVGTITIRATPIYHRRVQDEVEQTKKVIDVPEGAAIMQAAANTTPWGGIVSTAIGLGIAAFAGKKAVENGRAKVEVERQRNELIDGIERAKDDLGEKWGALTGHLEAEQSHDTKQAVKARVG